MFLTELLDRQAVNIALAANSKRHALQLVSDIAARNIGIESETILQGLIEREKQSSTGVGHGVAVPHAALKGLDRMRGVFIRLEDAVDFDSMDDRPVDLIFALLAPEEAGTEHLRALAKVSRVLRQKELREALRAVQTPDAVFALLTQSKTIHAA
jgi:nitrogen PTS system EIIA component